MLGINFKDDLGRCVIVVGLPYPNSHDSLFQYRLNYLEKQASVLDQSPQLPGQEGVVMPETTDALTAEEKVDTTMSRQDFMDNTCMNIVNQSIGIRWVDTRRYQLICGRSRYSASK